ncbi:radical SAM protein [Roseivirga seohaensis]|uniref:Radical SAM protein n=1 Tax=Roseivirga seohaensis TaxID=1914963 RepID=A0A150XL95_9BACT|nr:radical SAM protein [Roseivirga seohaensis]KYG79453.1 radical SAM protein [Roseivirga seohaensis]
MNKLLLFNPRSAKWKHRIPNSILQVGASIHGKFDYVFVDGNMEIDPWAKIEAYFKTGNFKYFGVTVMPGPQLKEAIPFTKRIRKEYPEIVNIWGGYFASNQYKVCLESGFVDVVINGPADDVFPRLLESIESGTSYEHIENLIFRNGNGEIVTTKKQGLLNQDELPDLPYDYLASFYPLKRYFGKTFLGKRTLSYHSSFGCPFTCSFCAVVPIYNARWKGKSAQKIYKDVKKLKDEYQIDAIEFHDNNFFTSRKRVVEFSELIMDDGISWWGEGRIDTLDQYKDEDLETMSKAGCRMIFCGAESGNDEVLKQMDKGGTQSSAQILAFAERMSKHNIIPEYSFVLGLPGKDETAVMDQIDKDIDFIKKVKKVNPNTEIIIYLYSPVPTEGSELHKQIIEEGFKFPEKLEDWLNPAWENFDLRKNPLTPWLTPQMIDKIKNFETVLNAYYPTVSDYRVTPFKRKVMRGVSGFRYKSNIYNYPYELKALQKYWLKYRQPEIEGFYQE